MARAPLTSADTRRLAEESGGELFVPGLGLWIDAHKPRDVGFVSHAHSDHLARHGRIVCTAETAALLEVWFERNGPPCDEIPYDQWRACGDGRYRLLPSGHILGSAMLHLETAAGSLLYAGDVSTCGSPTSPPARLVPADLLIVEDTFGHLDSAFLDPRDAADRVVELCLRARSGGRTPVLVTMSNCGKAQEATSALCAAGLRPALQTKLWRFAEVYSAFGHLQGGYAKLSHGCRNDCDVAIVSNAYLEFQGGDLSAMVPDPMYVLLSGWAASETDGRFDAVLAWSDHAARDDLLRIVEAVDPGEVWTFAGSGMLADEIRGKGIRGRHLG